MPRGALRTRRAAGWLVSGLALAALFLPAACGGGPGAKGDETTASSRDTGVLFPRQRPGTEALMSETSGELVLDDEGCLRVKTTPEGPGATPVWPAAFESNTSGGEVSVLDGEGRVVARVGERVYMGGGEIPRHQIELADERMRRELFERCPGDYWIVGSEVKMLEERG